MLIISNHGNIHYYTCGKLLFIYIGSAPPPRPMISMSTLSLSSHLILLISANDATKALWYGNTK